jgi:hypothetical protein
MVIPAICLFYGRLLTLHAIVLSVWAGMAMPHTTDEEPIAWAIAEAVDESPEAAVFGADRTVAVMAYYSAAESNNHLDAYSNLDAPAYGCWQQQNSSGKGDALTQARSWLRLLRLGSEICPQSPLAPLSGGCRTAYKLANRRSRTAWRYADLEF